MLIVDQGVGKVSGYLGGRYILQASSSLLFAVPTSFFFTLLSPHDIRFTAPLQPHTFFRSISTSLTIFRKVDNILLSQPVISSNIDLSSFTRVAWTSFTLNSHHHNTSDKHTRQLRPTYPTTCNYGTNASNSPPLPPRRKHGLYAAPLHHHLAYYARG